MEKCKFPEGVTIEVLRCVRCGHVEISWAKQDNTEKIV